MDMVDIAVNFRGEIYDLKKLDIEYLSLVVLINEVLNKAVNRNKYHEENFKIYGLIPKSTARSSLKLLPDDAALLGFVNDMVEKGAKQLEFHMEALPNCAQALTDEHPFEEPFSQVIQKQTQTTPIVPTPTIDDDVQSVDTIEWTDEEIGDLLESDSDESDIRLDVNDMSSTDNEDKILSDCDSIDEVARDSSDEEIGTGVEKMAKVTRANRFKIVENEKIELKEGQVFNDVDEFRAVLRDYAIQNGCTLNRIRNEKVRVTATCALDQCNWRIHASLLQDGTSFMIKTLKGEHTCLGLLKNPEITSKWVATKLFPSIKNNPKIKISAMASELLSKYNTSASKDVLYRAKRIAKGIASSDFSKSYGLLDRYGYTILKYNCGAIVKVMKEAVGSKIGFKRIFISFKAQRDTFWLGCRRLIGIDGCHLKTPYGGVLLSAVALDANSGIFPLAVCVAESENQHSWGWFFELFKDHMEVDNNEAVCFMSDRQKGIIAALKEHFPGSPVRFCARHVYANFRKTYTAESLRELFWMAARAPNKTDFDFAMDKIKRVDFDAFNWLMDSDPLSWSLHAFNPLFKSDHVTNNMSESWNAMLSDYRRKPILELLEFIRLKVMKMLFRRRQKAEEWESNMPPRVRMKISKISKEARRMYVVRAGKTEFEVIDNFFEVPRHYVVDLSRVYCECGGWQLSGIPCKHTLASIIHSHSDPIKYIDYNLTKEAYLKTYSTSIHPLPDRCNWPLVSAPDLLPPLQVVKMGRPKVKRKREINETSSSQKTFTKKCSLCHKIGHNKRGCPDKNKQSVGTSNQSAAQEG